MAKADQKEFFWPRWRISFGGYGTACKSDKRLKANPMRWITAPTHI